VSKIIKAANVMIENRVKISNVRPSAIPSTELFFLYDAKYKWSILHSLDRRNYSLHYYPGKQTIEELSSIVGKLQSVEKVSYSTDELKSREAFETFAELYSVVQSSKWEMEKILDEIIDEDNLPL